MKTKKRILAAVLIMALLTALTGCSTYPDVTIDLTTGEVRIGDQAAGDTQAKYNEAEPAGVKGELLYWSEDSAAAASIRDYVAEVTDINSDKYIPVEDRIAVFDMDGTLIGELYPSYFEYMMFIHRALHDDTFEAPDDMREFAEALEEGVYGGKVPDNSELLHAKYAGQAYAGMTVEEMRDYTRAFMQTEADGFTNLTKGDAFYWPMVSLVQYLADNDFTCYIVSGSSRTICREVIADWLPIPDNRVIGMSYSMLASGQGDTDGLEYVYSADDKVILGEDLILKTIKMNKVSAISQEIGKVPVLSFGNSSGDYSMANYVTDSNKYSTFVMMLCCDDLERENGNLKKAAEMEEMCQKSGWVPVSMKNDWKTIYGEGVTKKKAE
ncbi:MAG: haloacid dehalogenase-like hydrolase [Lachnospiraceae bacterium]|nr:haloacid dehalogenase-like hydrolase [Lachnospiraceae bacterium]